MVKVEHAFKQLGYELRPETEYKYGHVDPVTQQYVAGKYVATGKMIYKFGAMAGDKKRILNNIQNECIYYKGNNNIVCFAYINMGKAYKCIMLSHDTPFTLFGYKVMILSDRDDHKEMWDGTIKFLDKIHDPVETIDMGQLSCLELAKKA